MEPVPAVVCVDGMGINGLATVRSLGRRGVPVHVVKAKGSSEVASASRYCVSYLQVAALDSLYDALEELGQRLASRPVLYVDNDAMMKTLAPHAAALKRRFRVVDPIGDAERLIDKAFQIRAVREAGIPTPRTWFPMSWAEVSDLGRQTGKRLIAKPVMRQHSVASRGPFKTLLSASAERLAAELRAYAVSPEDVLVQEFIEGDDERIYAALCYRSGDRRSFVLSARKLRQTQPGAGVMAVGQVIDVPAIRDMTQRLAQLLDFRGVISTEFKLDGTDGKYYFIEWNARPAYFQSLGWKAGFDLAYLAYCDHVYPARLPAGTYRHSADHRWINLRGDLKHLAMRPRLALRPATWAPYAKSKEWAIWALDDPGPWARAMAQFGAGLIRRLAHESSVRGTRARPLIKQ